MRKAIESFRGEAPRVTPRALPDNAAQTALNAKLLSGDLEAWRQFALDHVLANTGSHPAQTLSRIGGPSGSWMSWDTVVDVARGTTPGDTTYRTYLTGPDQYAEPRFTTLALATTGSEPFPVATRPLGVPAPTTTPSLVTGIDPNATTFSVNVLDEGDALATSWVKNSPLGGSTAAIVSQDATTGNPAPSYKVLYDEIHNEGEQPFLYRNFGTAGAASIHASCDFLLDFYGQAIFQLASSLGGDGIQVRYQAGFLMIHTSSGWSPYAVAEAARVAVTPLPGGTWYTLTADISSNADGTKTVTAGLYAGSGQLGTVTATVTANFGNYCGFTNGTPDDLPPAATWYDNILVQATGSTGYTPTNLATAYVFTFVNDLSQESAPSLPSATVLRPDGIAVTVTTATTGPDAGYGVTAKRIYRAVTGSTGTAYQFVSETPLAQADFVDTLTDTELGEVLPSDLWALPPSDLEGILALPNGVMAGFSKNQLCLSAQNHPHAWPVQYRLNTDTKIVGIGNVDTTVVIGTESFVYVASGNDPAAYSMSKTEVPYACVSKLSIAYLTGIGVVFAGPDGLMAVVGIGQVRNLTESVFTRDQWQALVPSSMRAVAHNDIYWMFYDTGMVRGCYAIDMKATGFGVVEMAFHASAAYVDPVEDKMYLALDSVDEPADTYLPLPADPPTPADGKTVFEFEGHTTEKMVYRWRSKLWLMDHPSYLSIAQVRAHDYDNLLVRFYADGEQIHEEVIESEAEFTLPAAGPGAEDSYTEFEVELLGTSRVRLVQAADDVNELG